MRGRIVEVTDNSIVTRKEATRTEVMTKTVIEVEDEGVVVAVADDGVVEVGSSTNRMCNSCAELAIVIPGTFVENI